MVVGSLEVAGIHLGWLVAQDIIALCRVRFFQASGGQRLRGAICLNNLEQLAGNLPS